MLSGVRKHRKAVMGPVGKPRVLDELPSGASYSAPGREFKARGEPQYVLNQAPLHTHLKRGNTLTGWQKCDRSLGRTKPFYFPWGNSSILADATFWATLQRTQLLGFAGPANNGEN